MAFRGGLLGGKKERPSLRKAPPLIERALCAKSIIFAPTNPVSPLRILLLTKKFPYPLHDGEAIAIFGLLRELSLMGHELTVLAMSTPKHPAHLERLPAEVRSLARWEIVEVDTSIRAITALRNLLFSPLPYVLARFQSEAFAERLRKLLEENHYDIVQLEGIFPALYLSEIRTRSKAPVVLRGHNIEHEIWFRLAKETTNPLKRWYLKRLADRMARFERAQADRFDGLVPITQRDLNRFRELGYRQPALVVPAGADLYRLVPQREEIQFPGVFHLGSMDWLPNQEGVDWFLEKVWPRLSERHPDWRFYVAGRHLSAAFHERAAQVPGVVVVGEVPDAVEFMNRHALLVVPLRSGGGMRVKLVEALALGKTVVSTSIGAEGLEVEPGEHLLLADTPEDFAEAVEHCLLDRALFDRLGENALATVRARYDNRALAQRLAGWLAELPRTQS